MLPVDVRHRTYLVFILLARHLCYCHKLDTYFTFWDFIAHFSHFFCFLVHAKLVEKNVLRIWLACQFLFDMNISWQRPYSLRY